MLKKTEHKLNQKFAEEIEKLDEISKRLDRYYTTGGITLGNLVSKVNQLIEDNKTLKEQIDLLVNMNNGTLGESIGCELFAYKSYRGKPVIYKDGKLITEGQLNDIRVYFDSDGTVSVDLSR